MKPWRNPVVVIPASLVSGVALVASSPTAVAFAAVLAWPLVEYVAHRFAMHGARRWGRRAYRKIHGAHHDHPRDPSHYVVPPVAILAAAGLLAAVSVAFAGAMLVCLAAYDLVHLGCHGLGPLRGRLPSSLVAHHAGHHADDTRNFSVTCPVIDRVFQTVRA